MRLRARRGLVASSTGRYHPRAMLAFLRMWRRFSAVGLALVLLGIGVPYLFWRYETRGRFLVVADVIERELSTGRGVGAPSDESVRERVLEIAAQRSVVIDGLTVSHTIVSEPQGGHGHSMPEGTAEYLIEGTMRTTHQGLEVTAPLRGLVTLRFAAPPR